jgi:hypothetical protein
MADRTEQGRFSTGHPQIGHRQPGSRNKRSVRLAELLRERGDRDPLEFLEQLGKPLEEVSIELKVKIAAHLAPYLHARNTVKVNPTPLELRPLERASDIPPFIADLVARVAGGELDVDTATALKGLADAFLAGLNMTKVESDIAALKAGG